MFPSKMRQRTADPLTEVLTPGSASRAMLDSLAANCFVADTDLRIVYMNTMAGRTMQTLAPTLSSTFGVQLHDVLGGSIHRFHKDPRRIEGILNDPAALPRSAVFTFGGITLRTQINAVTTGDGQRIGYVVLWDNISQRLTDADTAYADVERGMTALNDVVDEMLGVARQTSEQASAGAAATEELNAAVAEIARASTEAADQINEAVRETAAGVQTLRELQASSSEIGDFLRLITGVSEQTRMLALNATIEAARAGDAGRGFAVVADEVKQLAGTTASSIGDIEARIAAIQAAADRGVDALNRIEQMIDRISASQSSVVTAIEEQSAVVSELAATVTTISDGADRTAEQGAASARAAERISEQTRGMYEMVRTS